MTDERPSSPFDQEQENQLNEQIEAERAANARVPTGLFALMVAPLLLIAIPLVLLWVLRSSPTNTTALAPISTTTAAEATPALPSGPSVAWHTSFKDALALAQKTGKPLMADFYADWCGPCKAMDAYTWTDASVVEESKNVIAVKVDIDAPENAEITRRYKINPLPCIIWMDSQGNEKGRNEGAVGPQDMLLLMQKYR